LLAHIASLGWEHIGFSGGYVWPSDPLKQKVSALRKLCSTFLDAAYRTIWNGFCDDPVHAQGVNPARHFLLFRHHPRKFLSYLLKLLFYFPRIHRSIVAT
jgi:hypothetical protein